MNKQSVRLINKAIYFIVSVFIISISHAAENTQNFCPNQLSQAEKKSLMYDAVINTYIAIMKDINDPKGIWDKKSIAEDPELAKALDEFRHDKRGHAAKKLRLSGLKSTEVHDLLISQGFKHKRVSLSALKNHNLFWLKDGTTTMDDKHSNIVPLYIYIHKDGSVIRVKPFGIPDLQAKTMGRAAHLSKTVLKKLPCDCTDSECKYDTSYSNEAFKVTDLGYAVPKNSSSKAGLKLPYDDDSYLGKTLNNAVSGTVANLSHIKLLTDCPQEPN